MSDSKETHTRQVLLCKCTERFARENDRDFRSEISSLRSEIESVARELILRSSYQGHTVGALALRGDEGRGKLR